MNKFPRNESLFALLKINRVYFETVVLVLNVWIQVGSLLRSIGAIRTLESGTLAALVLEVPPKSVSLLVNLAASLANVTQRLLQNGLLLLMLFLMRHLRPRQMNIQSRLGRSLVFAPVPCCKQVEYYTTVWITSSATATRVVAIYPPFYSSMHREKYVSLSLSRTLFPSLFTFSCNLPAIR